MIKETTMLEKGTVIDFMDGSYFVIEEYDHANFYMGTLYEMVYDDETGEFIEDAWNEERRLLSWADMKSRGIERIEK